MYSIGYINTCINSVLKDAVKYKIIKQTRQEIASAKEVKQEEVITDGDSRERNRNKADRLGVKSRFGEELDFDMFEGS